MVINTNISAQTSTRLLGESSLLLARSLARLSSGSKLVSPEDDAAGMAVSMRFDAQINRTHAATSNLGNALSLSQSQDGFLNRVGHALDRMSELSLLAQDVTKTDGDRSLYNKEFQSLSSYISDVTTKNFNGVSLFSGNALNVTSDSEGGTLQMAGIQGNYVSNVSTPGSPVPRPSSTTLGTMFPGFTHADFRAISPDTSWAQSDVDSSDTLATGFGMLYDLDWVLSARMAGSAVYEEGSGKLTVTLDAGQKLITEAGSPDDLLADLGFNAADLDNSAGGAPKTVSVMLTTPGPSTSSSAMDISTLSGAQSALTTVKTAIDQLASDRATLGATITRLNLTTQQLGNLKDNLSAANSRIKDVDVAQESTDFARFNILVQAGTAMLSQANSTPSSVLRLLG